MDEGRELLLRQAEALEAVECPLRRKWAVYAARMIRKGLSGEKLSKEEIYKMAKANEYVEFGLFGKDLHAAAVEVFRPELSNVVQTELPS